MMPKRPETIARQVVNLWLAAHPEIRGEPYLAARASLELAIAEAVRRAVDEASAERCPRCRRERGVA
ncbi:MAG TPA: hypothetical protein VNN07_02190 [Candidatus Tectomicrobia bacterium]|nr:hypothetical protein [Candidatus Tectomicrobia bacterium]